MITSLLHFGKLNESTFSIYLMHKIMENSLAFPISVDRTRIESQRGFDIIVPFDSILVFLQLKVPDKNRIYFRIPVKQLKTLRSLNRTNITQSFFVLSEYYKVNELISNLADLLDRPMFLFPESNKFDSNITPKIRYVRYDKIFPDPEEEFINQPHSFNELIEKIKSKKYKMPGIIKAKTEFSFEAFFKKYEEITYKDFSYKDLITKGHLFLFLKI